MNDKFRAYFQLQPTTCLLCDPAWPSHIFALWSIDVMILTQQPCPRDVLGRREVLYKKLGE